MLGFVEPIPNCPGLFEPQAQTLPSLLRASQVNLKAEVLKVELAQFGW